MINFIRNLANAATDTTKAEEPSRTNDSSRVIIHKLEEIPAKYYSDKVNEIILTEELRKASTFLSGDFIIDYVDEKSYTCSYMLYFQDKSNETYKVGAKSKPLDIMRLSAEARNDLEKNNPVKFEIPEPSEEIRKNYKLVKI